MTDIEAISVDGAALRCAVQAAKNFKYWIDIQPPGKVFHPSGKDVRSTDAYAKAAELLDAAETALKLD